MINKKIIAGMMASFYLFTGSFFSCGMTVYAADELCTVPITDEEGSIEDRKLTSYEVTSADGQYTVIVNGVTEANKVEYTEQILANIEKLSKDTPVKFTNNMFVDSEKYCYTKEGYDSYHCWLASSANMLVISGWDEDFENPILPAGTKSYEDEILAFFTSSFTDKGSLPENAISYFLNGDYGVFQRTGAAELICESTAQKPGDASAYAGCDIDHCAQRIVYRKDVDPIDESYLEAAKEMENLKNASLATSISFIDMVSGEGLGTSHSVTITGVVIDNTKTGLDRYVAMIIADSDNEECEDSFPDTLKEALADKKSKPNSYTMYELGKYKDAYDEIHWGIYGYQKDIFMEMVNLSVLQFKNEETKKISLESSANATKDCHKSADIVIANFFVHDEEYELKESFEQGKDLYVDYQIFNRSEYINLDKESAKKDNYQCAIYVYRDGAYIGEIAEGLSVDLTKNPIMVAENRMETVVLNETDFFDEPGTYVLEFVINTNDASEMYVINNVPMETTFEIVESKNGSIIVIMLVFMLVVAIGIGSTFVIEKIAAK